MASKAPPVGSRLRHIGWAAALGCALAGFLGLTFHVNAIKSEVRLVERKIIALQREKLMLETEFQTRASQHQLSKWNRLEFGYGAPRADQYLESERQLASLGSPRGLNAPEPIRVARAEPVEEESMFGEWVSPLTGSSLADETRDAADKAGPETGREPGRGGVSLAQRLAAGTGPAAGAEFRQ
ncbi:hypothetical protein [Qipengyuania sp. MTN3-11]|uniref:hypothetical protein n=1 Tax=Qipengyuania sp. MTN3-11 TaxID=3056557 RepID=UPI0036F21DFB